MKKIEWVEILGMALVTIIWQNQGSEVVICFTSYNLHLQATSLCSKWPGSCFRKKKKNGRCAKKSSSLQSASSRALSAQSFRPACFARGLDNWQSLDHPVAFLLQSCFNRVYSVRGANSNRAVLPPSLMVFSKVVHTLPFYSHIICSFLTVLATPPTILLLPSIPQVQEGADGRGGVGSMSAQHGNGVSGPVLQKSLPYWNGKVFAL